MIPKPDEDGRGHVVFGPKWFLITRYGDNAMHYAWNIEFLGTYWCFRKTTGQWGWYFYVSKDATPQRAVFGFGPGFER